MLIIMDYHEHPFLYMIREQELRVSMEHLGHQPGAPLATCSAQLSCPLSARLHVPLCLAKLPVLPLSHFEFCR